MAKKSFYKIEMLFFESSRTRRLLWISANTIYTGYYKRTNQNRRRYHVSNSL